MNTPTAELDFVSFVAVHYIGRHWLVEAELSTTGDWTTGGCKPVGSRGCRVALEHARHTVAGKSCRAEACNLLNWIRQTQRLAAAVAKRTARRASVHLWTRCISQADGPALSRAGQAPVVLHNSHDRALYDALLSMRRAASSRRGGLFDPQWKKVWLSSPVLNLLKWSAVGATWAELVVLLDLDMEPHPDLSRLPRPLLHASRQEDAMDAWAWLLRCAQAQNASL